MPEPILYSFRRCPYAMRARMALLVSGVPFELREVKLSAKPPEMLAASAKGTVPVLVTAEGEVVDESLEIMRWALLRHDPEHWLDGDDPDLIAANDGPFKHHLDRYKYADRHGSDAGAHRDQGVKLLFGLEDRLRTSPYLCGPERSLSDVAIMPFVRQFAATDRAWFEGQPLPRLRQWLAVLTMSALFERAMARVEPWRAA